MQLLELPVEMGVIAHFKLFCLKNLNNKMGNFVI